MNSPNSLTEDSQMSQKSEPRYVTVPFEYYRMLVEHYHSLQPTAQQEQVFTAEDPDPEPVTVGETLNLKGINLFDEMPAGYRKLTNDAD